MLQDRGYKKTKYKHGTERDGFHVKRISNPLDGTSRGIQKTRTERWGSDEDLMRSSDIDELSKNSDGKGETVVSVEMQDFKREGSRSRSRSRLGMPQSPEKAKLKEIRVASTWEIRVEDSEGV